MHYLYFIRNIFVYLFLGLFFVFPKLQPICFGIAFILSVFTPDFRKVWLNSFLEKTNLLFVSFFIISAISILYSKNIPSAWAGIELKLSFLIFPLFFPAILNSGGIKVRRILEFTYLSAFISFLILFLRASYRFISGESLNVFFSSEFSFIVHPSYLAVALNVLLAILLYRLVVGKTKLKKLLTPITILILYIGFTSSKIGLIILLVNALIFVLIYAISNKAIIKSAITLAGILVICFLSIKFIPKLNAKFSSAYTEFSAPREKGKLQSTGQRLVAWEATSELIKDNWLLGVGIGDLKDELTDSYKKMGFPSMNKKKLDSHQQFMQTWASIGVIGFISLLFVFIFIFFNALKKRNLLLFVFGIIFLLFGLTESMFETQAGVLSFLSFFYLLTNGSLLRILNKKNV